MQSELCSPGERKLNMKLILPTQAAWKILPFVKLWENFNSFYSFSHKIQLLGHYYIIQLYRLIRLIFKQFPAQYYL